MAESHELSVLTGVQQRIQRRIEELQTRANSSFLWGQRQLDTSTVAGLREALSLLDEAIEELSRPLLAD